MDKQTDVIEPLDHRDGKTKHTLTTEGVALLGVPVRYTTFSWLLLPFHLVTMLPIAFWREEEHSLQRVLLGSLRFGTLLHLTYYLHAIGHILSGKAVGAPMDELIVSATRQVNHYEGDQSQYRASTHIARALGGPLLNLLVAWLSYVIYRKWNEKPAWLAQLALFNSAFALIALAPVEQLDGGAILQQLRRPKEGQQ
jgi:Zn-dependent protease